MGTLNVKTFGAKGNSVANDTAAIQAAINAAPAGSVVYFPVGDYLITNQLSISKSITLQGDTHYVTSILCVGCSGLLVASVSNVNVFNLEIAAAVRHTTTPNSYIGIDISGDTVNRPFNHVYRDVYLDGFQRGVRAAWLWSCVFDNIRVSHCKFGIEVTHLSANNVVVNSTLGGDASVDSAGILLDGTLEPSEGWTISNTVIDQFYRGIWGFANTHVFVSNCILDHNRNAGVKIDSAGANFGGNWTIIGNYIAMVGALGDAAIWSTNSVANSQNRGNHIADNQILCYSGATCPIGVLMEGAEARYNIIKGNSFKGFGTFDIKILAGPDIITENMCLSSVSSNITAGVLSVVADNVGSVAYQRATNYSSIGSQKITYDEAVPTTGTWARGDWCLNVLASAGGIPGWVCVADGTPGTWKAMAAVAV